MSLEYIDTLFIHDASVPARGFEMQTEHYTGSIDFQRELMSQESFATRLSYNLETTVRLIKQNPQQLLDAFQIRNDDMLCDGMLHNRHRQMR